METFDIQGLDFPDNRLPMVNFVEVWPGYFNTMSVPILEGRGFNISDTEDTEHVAIISQGIAKLYFAGESPIGKLIRYNPNDEESPWLRIVGVNSHILQGQPMMGNMDKPTIYLPLTQRIWGTLMIAVKTEAAPMGMQQILLDISAKVDPEIPLFNIIDLDNRLKNMIGGIAYVGNLFSIFGVFAVVLAASGIYGVMSRSVVLRTQEIGVRRALGADDQTVVQMLLKESSLQLLVGAGVGSILGFLGGQLLSNIMLNMMDHLPFVIAYVLVVISLVFLVATLVPAFRAIRMEPNAALRYE
jgi:ABC-type antimicrobial peptide transport system permease subunit